MRRPAALLCLTILATPAQAEDFTGFYAGVNAGYARSKGGESPGSVPGPGSAPAPVASKLPPSAASAARAMESARTGAAKAR